MAATIAEAIPKSLRSLKSETNGKVSGSASIGMGMRVGTFMTIANGQVSFQHSARAHCVDLQSTVVTLCSDGLISKNTNSD